MSRAEGPEDATAAWRSWLGQSLLDPDGTRLGHVVALEPDALGGAYAVIQGDWGALDFLASLGGMQRVHRTFRFHSDEIEDGEPGKLVLKRSALARRE